MNNDLQNQIKNKETAIKQLRILLNVFFNATADFKNQISRETFNYLL